MKTIEPLSWRDVVGTSKGTSLLSRYLRYLTSEVPPYIGMTPKHTFLAPKMDTDHSRNISIGPIGFG